MEIVDRKPVPIYETICGECKSTTRYKKAEVRLGSYITCPVCGMSVWAGNLRPIEFEEGRTMTEYIDRDAVIKAIEFNKGVGCSDRCVQGIKYIPAADVKPVLRARWVICCDGYYPYCSNCRQKPQGRIMTDFCPNCGADMREG